MWTKEKIIENLKIIKNKNFISIPDCIFRKDDGIVGQLLEKEFNINENNLNIADLGLFELKGMRLRKNKTNMLTLFHKTSASGLTPIEIFKRFGYIKKSNRSNITKKKLFTTIYGNKYNNLGMILKAHNENEVCLYYQEEYLATWDLSEAKEKIKQVILVFAESRGIVNSKNEQFHYTNAYLLHGLRSLSDAISQGAVVMDLCIDQPADQSSSVHDRGPHIRIPIRKLEYLYNHNEILL